MNTGRRGYKRVVLIYVILIATIVPTVALVLPWWSHRNQLAAIQSNDHHIRQQALNGLIDSLNGDEIKRDKISRDIFGTLEYANDAGILQTAEMLNGAMIWEREKVPMNIWLRWLEAISKQDDPSGKLLVCEEVRKLEGTYDSKRVLNMLLAIESSLDEAKHGAGNLETIQRQILFSLAFLNNRLDAKSRVVSHNTIKNFSQSGSDAVQRHAWILRGLLGLIDEYDRFDPNTKPSLGASEAKLWAMMQIKKPQENDLVRTLHDKSYRTLAIYPLHQSKQERTQQAILNLLELEREKIEVDDQVAIWRAILSSPQPNIHRKPLSRNEFALAIHAEEPGDDAFQYPLVTAASYRFGIGHTQTRPENDPFGSLVKLAVVESNAHEKKVTWAPFDGEPPLLKIISMRYAVYPQPEYFYEALRSDQTPIVCLAAHIAATTLNTDQLIKLRKKLVEDNDTRSNIALCTLHITTGLLQDDINDISEATTDWTLKQTAKIAKWMTDHRIQENFHPTTLLNHSQFDNAIVWLAMLYMDDENRANAIRMMFDPVQQERESLTILLDQQRWIHLLNDFASNRMQPFWVWADPSLQQFQLEILTNQAMLEHGL
ncbi:hypothetical protein [Poriferisphaera sp. WC338]|uniref:hypothetical protein n=1 Tax=Poriferisphaera sp. WC338 TaxID=3425129 RepID=UPI003D814D4D